MGEHVLEQHNMSKFKVRAAYGEAAKWIELERGMDNISTIKSLIASKFGLHNADLSAYMSGGRVAINSAGSFNELVDNSIKTGKKWIEIDVNHGSSAAASYKSSSSSSAARSSPSPSSSRGGSSSSSSSSSAAGSGPVAVFKNRYNDVLDRFNALSDSAILRGEGEKIYKEFIALFPELKTLYSQYQDELRSTVDSFNEMNKKIPEKVNAVIRNAS